MGEILSTVIIEKVKTGIKDKLYQRAFFLGDSVCDPESRKEMERVAEDIVGICQTIDNHMTVTPKESLNATILASNTIIEILSKVAHEKGAKSEGFDFSVLIVESLMDKAISYLEPLSKNPKHYNKAKQAVEHLVHVIAMNVSFFLTILIAAGAAGADGGTPRNVCLFEISLIELFCNFLCDFF